MRYEIDIRQNRGSIALDLEIYYFQFWNASNLSNHFKAFADANGFTKEQLTHFKEHRKKLKVNKVFPLVASLKRKVIRTDGSHYYKNTDGMIMMQPNTTVAKLVWLDKSLNIHVGEKELTEEEQQQETKRLNTFIRNTQKRLKDKKQ